MTFTRLLNEGGDWAFGMEVPDLEAVLDEARVGADNLDAIIRNGAAKIFNLDKTDAKVHQFLRIYKTGGL